LPIEYFYENIETTTLDLLKEFKAMFSMGKNFWFFNQGLITFMFKVRDHSRIGKTSLA